ncbi:hypothetical protein HPB50_004423 [Hyalomma asiaticum]|uniref:Uncharacterized protein n=1 Tax=Hyalomma asiaticum TaxID=266040 RepID=A0ACB7TEU7_HYAAI|nr:hypothetical protein HPB50_004423 [Hyalomma asiaticum]
MQIELKCNALYGLVGHGGAEEGYVAYSACWYVLCYWTTCATHGLVSTGGICPSTRVKAAGEAPFHSVRGPSRGAGAPSRLVRLRDRRVCCPSRYQRPPALMCPRQRDPLCHLLLTRSALP